MDDNKVKYGLKNVYYAKGTVNDDGGIDYDKPVHIPGAVTISLDAEGGLTPWYADNVVYTILNNNAGYSGDLEIALMPDSFAADILHEEFDMFIVMVEKTERPVEHFALMFQFEGDRHAIRHVLYNCICDRPPVESATTEDAKEPQTDTLHLTVLPRADGVIKARTGSQTPNDVFDGWFDGVYDPENESGPVTHTVRFYNGGTLLQSVEVADGADAAYTGSTPVSADDPNAAFIGWEPEPKNVTADMDCFAQFEYKVYSVEFWNGDTLLQTVQVKYGENAVYTGSTPVSPDNPDWEFTGWDPDPTGVTADMKCYAQYEEAAETYTVWFYNGTTLLQTVTGIPYGGSASYTGSTPVSDEYPEAQFTGWNPEPTNITKDTQCFATYNTETFTVWFYNGRTLLQTVTGVLYGAAAIYDGDTPENSDDPTRTFIGWEPVPENITQNTACYAQYSDERCFAVYSADDHSLEFYSGIMPEEGEKYNGRTATSVYTRFLNVSYSGLQKWSEWNSDILSAYVDESFSIAKPLNVAYWFSSMRYMTTADISNLNLELASNLECLFIACTSLTDVKIPDSASKYAVSVQDMFSGCKSLKTLDLSGFTAENVTNFRSMFYDCTLLEEVKMPDLNARNVNALGSMFQLCESIKEIDLSGIHCVDFQSSEYIFSGCTNLEKLTLPYIDSVDTSRSSCSLLAMCSGCSNLTALDVSKFNTANITRMVTMFQNCSSLATIYSDDSVFMTDSLTASNNMFTGCTNLVGGNGTKYSSSHVTATYAHVDAEDNPGYFTDVNSSPYTEPVADSNGEIYDDWDTIIKKTEDGTGEYTVGQHKPLDLGDEGVINIEIVGENTDVLADGSGYARYTWIAKELLKTSHQMNPWDWHSDTTTDGSNEDGTFNEGTGGIGGWEKSDMRAYMKSSVWPLIPSNVRNAIKTVTKSQTAYDTSGDSFTQNTEDDIWIASSNEANTSNGKYREVFTDSSARIRCVAGTDTAGSWWLRNSGGHSNYYRVTDTGGTGNSTSSFEYYICLGFCI